MILPSGAENRRVDDLIDLLEDFASIIVNIQSRATKIAHLRVLFDEKIHKYPSKSTCLSVDSPIVAQPVFENALVSENFCRSR